MLIILIVSVVSLIYPTSNHNRCESSVETLALYLLYILHQTTTICRRYFAEWQLYLLYILHQTTTLCLCPIKIDSCISYISYIKPQLRHILRSLAPRCISYISYIKPQLFYRKKRPPNCCISYISYIKPQHRNLLVIRLRVVSLIYPTSNHNRKSLFRLLSMVVSLIYPTSNHNYILPFDFRD